MLKDKRKQILEHIEKQKNFIAKNAEAIDIYEGNLLPYVDYILRESLSGNYYKAIKHRIIPINILQRYIDKVSTAYEKAPTRKSQSERINNFIEFYVKEMNFNQSGMIADQYSHLSKGFAWKPYVNKDRRPAIRELSMDRFTVLSDSRESPTEETIFVEFMGKVNDKQLYHAYTDTEFDAFFDDESEYSADLINNGGVNLYGVIPYVYGKRQKNKLIPSLDTDIIAITKSIPVSLTDAAGAQMFQCFSIIFGVDVNTENLTMSPNAFWSFKSDRDKETKPEIGTIKPEADTEKVMDFIINTFVLWLETKGIRVGSIGSTAGMSSASGIAKIIDEMDVYSVKKKSMEWFKKDEEDFWNFKMPKIHNQWIKSGMVDASYVPPLITENVDVSVEFEFPEPMIPRSELLNNLGKEIDIGLITLKRAAKIAHPEYTEDDLNELEAEYGMATNKNFDTQNDQTKGQG